MDDFQDVIDLAKAAKGVPVFRNGMVALADKNVVVVTVQWRVDETLLLTHGSIPLTPPEYLLWLVDGKPVAQDEIPAELAQNMWHMVAAATKRAVPWLRGE